MFSTIFPPKIGGPATQSFNLCKALVEKGETPIVVTYGDAFTLSQEHGFKVYTFRLKYTYTPLDKALRWVFFPPYIIFLFVKERIQILHCHSVSALSFVAALIGKIMGIPSIVKFAGDWVWETLSTHKLQKAEDFNEMYKISLIARLMTKVEKVGLGLFDKIWVVSEFRRQNIKDLLGTDKKVFLINNCLLLDGGGARTWKDGDQTVMISANRFIPHKRVSFIVELFALSMKEGMLVLIGGGAQKEVDEVKEAIKKSGVDNRVELKGILSSKEVYSEFSKASFYISTSLEEGLPNVFIEAMHYGLPIITSDVGGSKEMVLDGKTGFVVDKDDKSGFIDRIHRLNTDLELRNRMSEAAYQRSKLFNLKDKIGEFIAIYKELIRES